MRPSALVLPLAALLTLGGAGGAGANPIDLCLDRTADPRAALAGCDEAAAIVRLLGRETKRSDPHGSPVLPPVLRASQAPLAEIELARAAQVTRLGAARPSPASYTLPLPPPTAR